MRILSIDYGKKRTGLAVTDPLQIIANGLATVSTHELFTYIETYIQKEQVERIVIGKPMQPNGQPSENLARVENFYNRWRKAHPEIPIEYYDERFTSVLAHRAMIDGGVKKKVRKENKNCIFLLESLGFQYITCVKEILSNGKMYDMWIERLSEKEWRKQNEKNT